MTITVPWNTMWTGELAYSVRPCRWVEGRLALHQPHRPGEGRPLFKRPHNVRQRRSVAQILCTVCGEHAPPADRWWFQHGEFREALFMTTEAPVHRKCGELALEACPHLQAHAAKLDPFPGNWKRVYALLDEATVDPDFGVRLNGRAVVGALKFAWPEKLMKVRRAGE